MSKLTLNDIVSGYASHTAYNTNNALIETALENTLSRDGTSPNYMNSDIDMNSNSILNLASLDVDSLSINGIPVIPTGTIVGEIPIQTGHNNKFLQTNGTTVSWQVPESDEVTFLPAGAGAISTTVQAHNRLSPKQSEFATNANFVTAIQALKSGQLYTDSGAVIERIPDRLVIGDAVDMSGDSTATTTTWAGVSPQPGLGWIEKNATLVSYASIGSIGIAGGARTSQQTAGGALGLVGIVYNDNTINKVNAWALYLDAKSAVNADGPTWGTEIDVTTMGTYVDFYASAGSIATLGAITGGTLYTDGTYYNVPLTGGTGTKAYATIVVSGGAVTSVTITKYGKNYVVADSLSALNTDIGGTGSGFSVPVATLLAYDNKTFGVTLAAGGDPAVNGSTDSCTVGYQLTANGGSWGRGIAFASGALRAFTDAAGVAHYKALVLRNQMQLGWEDADGLSNGFIRSNITTNTSEISLQLSNNNFYVNGYANKAIVQFGNVTNAVNYIHISNNIAGSRPQISAVGSDANIDLGLSPKGTGLLRFGTWTSNADAAITGYVTIKDSGGTSRKLATIA